MDQVSTELGVRDPAVTLHRAGRVIAMTQNVGNAFVVCCGRVVAVGDEAVLRSEWPGAELIDHGGRTIVPGFFDAHMHPAVAAEDALCVDLSPENTRNLDEVTQALQDAAAGTRHGDWVRASRYDHVKSTEGVVLDRAYLDRICPDHPVIVTHIAFHWGIVNSKALELGGFSEDSIPPTGGGLGRDGSGRLNGLIYEQVLFDYIYPYLANRPTVVPFPALEDRVRALRRVTSGMHAAGITSVCDMWSHPGSVEMFMAAEARGDLTMRTDVYISYKYWRELNDMKIRHGFGSDRLKFGGIKVMTDGAAGGGTCYLNEPYNNTTNDRGMPLLTPDELFEIARPVHEGGMRLAVHANGDAAVDMTLDCMERLQRETPRPGLRHRIEHCSMVSRESVLRIRNCELSVAPFGNYAAFHGKKLLDWYGDRVERMFAHRWFLDAGIPVGGSSDYTVSPYEPLYAIQSCVSRTAADGTVVGASQRISVDEALWVYTVGSSLVAQAEHEKGRLAPGYFADFVVLNQDPHEVPVEAISTIEIDSTWVDGEMVFSSNA